MHFVDVCGVEEEIQTIQLHELMSTAHQAGFLRPARLPRLGSKGGWTVGSISGDGFFSSPSFFVWCFFVFVLGG